MGESSITPPWATVGRKVRQRADGFTTAIWNFDRNGAGAYLVGVGFVSWHMLAAEWELADNTTTPPWATVGRKIMAKTGAWSGEIVRLLSNGVTVKVDDDHFDWTLRSLAEECMPVDEPAADRSLEQIKGAILHELRSSGSLGLSADELCERIGPPLDPVVVACDDLVRGGRARWEMFRSPALLQLTGCQLALDKMAEAFANADALAMLRGAEVEALRREQDEARDEAKEQAARLWGAAEGREQARCRERDEARAAEEALRRGVEQALWSARRSELPWCSREIEAHVNALQKALNGASAEGVHLLERLDEAERVARCEAARAVDAENERDTARFEVERLKTIVGGRALSAIGAALAAHSADSTNDGGFDPETLGRVAWGGREQAFEALEVGYRRHAWEHYGVDDTLRAVYRTIGVAVANHVRRVIGRAVAVRASDAEATQPRLYADGFADASLLASYGPVDLRVLSKVRIVFPEGTTSIALLLNDLGPEDNGRRHRFVLGSGNHGRMLADSDGRICGSPVRIHPEDLEALLQSAGLRDQHKREDGSAASDCQQSKSSGVGEVSHGT